MTLVILDILIVHGVALAYIALHHATSVVILDDIAARQWTTIILEQEI